jgi:hypothetical protein
MSIVNRPDKLPEFATQDLVDPTTGLTLPQGKIM